MSMKCLMILLVGIGSFFTAVAQGEEEPQMESGRNNGRSDKINSIYGKLIDKNTGKAIEAASVQLYPAGKKKTSALLDGMLSHPNGEFLFQNLQPQGSFRLVITAIGYETMEQDIIINKGGEKNERNGFERDLGNIVMTTNFKQLEGVTVTNSRPALEMGIDRKVFNVDKSITATGGTAIDIMKNIPSVSVDIEGNVELRNSTPQIFVDGRPTILTLDQIPADHIEKIELITNPSAKFDAASSGGIINVVLKKNKRIGLNGVASVSVGTPKVLSGNLNLNMRQGKFNVFVSAGHNQSGGIAKGSTLRENLKGGAVTDYFNQYSENERSRNFNSIRFGTDIFISNRNTVTISQSFSKGDFGNEENQDQEYLNSNRELFRYGTRTSDDNSGFNRNSTRLNYKYNFPKPEKELTADVSYNYGGRDNRAVINNRFFNPDGTTYQPESNVWNYGSSNEKQFTVQVDYANPVTDFTKIEMGLRTYHNAFTSLYDAYARDNGLDIKLPLSNNYAYTEMINAAYFTYSYKKEKFSYQLGLRAEQAKFDGELVDSAYKFGYDYPSQVKNIWDALFPSFFITKKIAEKDELQFNYTRRIRRPRFWQLNPFIDINDPANIRQGNPELRPEYVNSFELNYSRDYNKGNLLAVLYFRSNPNDITQYSDTITDKQYQQLNNAAVDPNAILNTYINASTTNRYGIELTLQHKPGKNLEITPTLNLQYRTVKATVNNLDLSNKGLNWEAKLIGNYKLETKTRSLFNNLGFQMTIDYESPTVIPQGKRKSEFTVDLGIKKEFLKDKKATVSLAVNDLFNTRRWGTIYDTEQFYQDSYRRWNVRNFRISFSYKFGDSKFSLGGKGSGKAGAANSEN
ncbi:MAG: TonB-dependent receptor [Chitinophagaceae bacterium]|nr:TonB-dependent receptor [Chitinophagaceae bacterium]